MFMGLLVGRGRCCCGFTAVTAIISRGCKNERANILVEFCVMVCFGVLNVFENRGALIELVATRCFCNVYMGFTYIFS